MTESADQPLLTEQAPASKKPAKKRAVKATAAAAKPAKTPKTTKAAKSAETAKPEGKPAAKKAPARKKSAKAAALEAQPELPVVAETAPAAAVAPPAEMPAPVPPTAAPVPQPGAEEWSPSRSRAAAAAPNPVAPTAPGPVQEAPAPAAAPPPVVKQRPVYIPLHVARQMEEQARADGRTDVQIPVAMPADQAPKMERMERPERYERPDRHGRHERQERSENVEATPRVELPPREEEIGEAEGLVEVSGKGFGFLRDAKRGFTQHPSDVFVTPELCRTYNLRDGQWVKGQTRRGNRGAQLFKITELNGDSPELANTLPAFDELTVISPLEKIRLETVPERYTTRIVDLMCPIGKGTRGLIVAPPRTGKTTLLQHIADAVVKNHPEIKLIILLVDERPEEVTDIRRSVPSAEIMASSNDMDTKSHTRIAQLAMERAKRLVESGKDVFILLDSITRVGRAFNNAMTGGRTMSGGLDSRALEIPRKIFAAARNTEEAGSLTIIATALIETNSRMDEVIFQEFKGTGNMELVLDRKISDMRIYPAIDIFQSGTRRDELLIPADDLHKINVIRRGLAGHKPVEAIERLLFFAKKFPTNAQMLREIPG
jgi:transcription termination factor Rho